MDGPTVSVSLPKKAAKKSVSWGVVETIEFRVSYSSCVVPSGGGPPVGIIGSPIGKSVAALGNDAALIEEEDRRPRCDMNDVWICPVERVRILEQESGFLLEDIALMCREIQAIQQSRAYAQLDFDTSFMLGSGNVQQLELLRDLRLAMQQPHHQPREKIVLLEHHEIERTQQVAA
ncbi:hypothetical protein P43SY_009918 [Pythium insidiosum]|uniref:Uncharacterized protein n=1 Tax=Pythium insidiosum TaxID=114742 RepID=A0AAD5MA11_PYTIN|nr:hypothetical protein P43SY_009918 [Pythium insidiosum]